jgi:DNA-binding NarL/FixJ family response regulator
VYLGPGVPKTVLARIAAGAKTDPYEQLTTRERQVLQLVAEGKTNKRVAEMLGLSVKTVDTHRAHLMKKLNIHNQTSLIKYALKKQIVHIP